MFTVLHPCMALDIRFLPQPQRAVVLGWESPNARPEVLTMAPSDAFSEEADHGLRPNFTLIEE